MKKSLFALALTVLGFGVFTSQANAQNYGYNSKPYGYQPNHHAALGQNISQLHQYGNYMTNYYNREASNCRYRSALLAEMRRYNSYTGSLVNAYRGSCPKTYRTACGNVRSSLSKIQNLSRNAYVSPSVAGYINRSCPLATYVNKNYSYFRPVVRTQPTVVHRPTHNYNRGYGHHGSYKKDKGLDVGSAIFGAIAGRIIHEIVK